MQQGKQAGRFPPIELFALGHNPGHAIGGTGDIFYPEGPDLGLLSGPVGACRAPQALHLVVIGGILGSVDSVRRRRPELVGRGHAKGLHIAQIYGIGGILGPKRRIRVGHQPRHIIRLIHPGGIAHVESGKPQREVVLAPGEEGSCRRMADGRTLCFQVRIGNARQARCQQGIGYRLGPGKKRHQHLIGGL